MLFPGDKVTHEASFSDPLGRTLASQRLRTALDLEGIKRITSFGVRQWSEAMKAVLRKRLGCAAPGAPPPTDPAAARRHLVDGLGRLISRYTGVDDPADEGLARLARRERHRRHRLYWAARLAVTGRWPEIDLPSRLWPR